MNDLDFILGTMRANTNALGFIPDSTVDRQYLTAGRYLMQTNWRGNRTGYLLHGAPTAGGVLTVAQAVVDYDHRQHGFGEQLVTRLIERAQIANCRAITLRCADNLDANLFWLAQGFEHTATLRVANTRRRAIHVYTLDLWPTLFGKEAA